LAAGAYRELTHAEILYKELVWDTTITAGLAVAETYVAVLRAPVIKGLFEFTVRTVGNWIYKNLVLVTDIAAIHLVNADHQAAYDKASLVLEVIAHDKGIDSPEFARARDEAKIALSRFASFGG